MADPESIKDRPISKPEVQDNIPVQDGADKVYERQGVRGKNTILLVTLVLAVVISVLASRYLF